MRVRCHVNLREVLSSIDRCSADQLYLIMYIRLNKLINYNKLKSYRHKSFTTTDKSHKNQGHLIDNLSWDSLIIAKLRIIEEIIIFHSTWPHTRTCLMRKNNNIIMIRDSKNIRLRQGTWVVMPNSKNNQVKMKRIHN